MYNMVPNSDILLEKLLKFIQIIRYKMIEWKYFIVFLEKSGS